MNEKYSDEERKLEVSLILAAISVLSLVAGMAFSGIHYLFWLPGIFVCLGVVVSNAMQLNRIDELRIEGHEEDYWF